jgi:probable rRNA maturation factor
MILLDPDLDSGPALTSDGAKRADGPDSARTPPRFRLPSARALARFLHQAQDAVKLRGEVSVLLTTDGAMRKMNRQFRGKDKATDVLSFPALEPSQVSKSRPGPPGNQEQLAGDLAISVETAQRQAADNGHALTMEIKILILHGLLHLSGYDHESDDGKMARRERALRGRLRLRQGLIERAVSRKGRAADSSTASAKADSAQDDKDVGARSKSASRRVSESVGQRVGKSAISRSGRKSKRAGSLLVERGLSPTLSPGKKRKDGARGMRTQQGARGRR